MILKRVTNMVLSTVSSIKKGVTYLLKKQYVLLFLKAGTGSVIVFSLFLLHQKNLGLISQNLKLFKEVALITTNASLSKSDFSLAKIAFDKQLRFNELNIGLLSVEYSKVFLTMTTDVLESFKNLDRLGTINSYRLLKSNITYNKKLAEILLKNAEESYKGILSIKN
jgi:hypothetical protein